MSRTMNNQDLEQQLKEHATKLAKRIKSEADLNTLTQKPVMMAEENGGWIIIKQQTLR